MRFFEDGDEITDPACHAALLAPGIRQALFRFGSMRQVAVDDDGQGGFRVTYTLITGESRTVDIPCSWIERDQYARIIDFITKDLQ